MRVVITDTDFDGRGDDFVIREAGEMKPCCGCFSCWLKTPGKCIKRDGLENVGEKLGLCDELIIISECVFGGFSPFVKKVLDRSIGYVSALFEIREGEMHHRRRYVNNLKFEAVFYGDGGERERNTARQIVKANAINLFAGTGTVKFCENAKEAELWAYQL